MNCDPQYENISQGRGLQRHLAFKLHQETGVPEGMCGLPEIQRMQAHLRPQGYQIKSMKESVGRYGIVTHRLILRLKNCAC